MRFILIITTALTAILCLPVSATIINVPDDYGTIQEGIDASFDDDTVLVSSGTYSGTGNINLATNGKAILVKGETGAIIDGQSQDVYGFYLNETDEDTTTIIDGFTIMNTEDGMRLYLASPKLINLNLTSNTAHGVHSMLMTSPSIENCEFADNLNGVGITSEWGNSGATIINCSFQNNSLGINIGDRASSFIRGCTFEGNGTGIDANNPLYESGCTVDSCSFINNGGALAGGFTLTNSYIADGVAGMAGDLFGSGSEYYVSNCLIENMSGRVFSGTGYNALVSNCIIRNNTGQIARVGQERRLEFNNCQFYGNTGEILAEYWDPRLTMTDCLYYDNNSPITINAIEYGGLTMSGCTIYGNHCTGIDARTIESVGWPGINITNTIIAENDSCGFSFEYVGDPIYSISYCDFYNNAGGNYCDIPDLTGQDGNISCNPMFCDPTNGNFYLADSSGCVGAGSDSSDIGAYGAGCGFDFEYLPGDANMTNGAWPPEVIGGDVTYLVNYFRGLPANPSCLLQGFWCSADANGDCLVIGSDVTRLVTYFRGIAELAYCLDYEPAWTTPEGLPMYPPPGWPNCE